MLSTPLLVAAALAAQPAPTLECGTKTLYDKTLTVRVVGPDLTCEQARAIVDRRRCRARKRWSCFSFRAPDPLLVWFRERERFAEHWSTYIEGVRPPCEQARVTRAAWREAKRAVRDPFPTRMQVLADDLMRCGQLDGMTRREVTALLGRGHGRGRHRIEWEIGPERDSLFQIDSEYLVLRFGRDDVLKKIEMVQG